MYIKCFCTANMASGSTLNASMVLWLLLGGSAASGQFSTNQEGVLRFKTQIDKSSSIKIDGELSDINPYYFYYDLRFYTQMSIGEPAQNVSLFFDTDRADSWMFAKGCENNGCAKHNYYDKSKSSSFKDLHMPVGLFSPDGIMYGNLYSDDVTLAGRRIKNQAFVAVDNVPGKSLIGLPIDGMIGMCGKAASAYKQKTFMQNLIEQGVIKQDKFSMHSTSKEAHVSIGDYALDALDGELTFKPIFAPQGNLWQFMFEGVSWTGQPSKLKDTARLAVIGTTYPFLIGPSQYVDAFNKHIGAVHIGSGIYELPNCDNSKLIEFVIHINGKEFPATKENLMLKVQRDNTSQCLSALVSWQSDAWVFGTPFVGPYFVAFDNVYKQIGFGHVKT